MTEDTHDDFYRALRRRIAAFLERKGKGFRHAQVLLLAPDLFHLMCKLVVDKRVPPGQKARLAAAIAYFVSPIELLPEAVLGPIGYLDDIALAAYALHGLINAGHGELAKEHWVGEGDLLAAIQHVLSVGDELVGSGILQKLRNLLDRSA